MPYLEQVVTHINDTLKAALSSATIKLSLHGCSHLAEREGDTVPLFIDNGGEGEFNAFDDNFGICAYHRCASTTYGESPVQGFGDNQAPKIESNQMAMIVWADREKIKSTQEQIASVMAAIMPYEFIRAEEKKYGISNTFIEAVSIDHNQRAIWSRELQGVDYALPPGSAYFQINYTIQAVYEKDCLEICIC